MGNARTMALALLAAATPVAAQETEAETVALLRGGNGWRERIEGINAAYRLGLLGPDASPDLRTAVINAAWAGWTELRGDPDTPPEGIGGWEADLGFLHAVQELRHPDGLPFLIEAAGAVGGSGIPNDLADFGAAMAFEPVLAAASEPDGHPRRVSNSLTALRFMIEDGALSAGQTERMRAAVRERLSRPQQYLVATDAVRIALALGDPELREMVEQIADDRATAEALVSPYLIGGGMSEEPTTFWVDQIQENARIFLDGGGADIGPFRRRGGSRS